MQRELRDDRTAAGPQRPGASPASSGTGMRPSGLRRDVQDARRGIHHARTFNQRRCRSYGEVDELVAAIDGLWDRHEALASEGILTPLVFCRRLGQPIKSFWKRWRTACEEAGCPGRIPHDFRRTAVRNLNRSGVTEAVAMKITGHKTRSVFDRYDITSDRDIREAMVKTGSRLKAQPSTRTQALRRTS